MKKEIDRRKFITSGAEATAGAALGFTILSSSASGASFNGTVRVAVIGVNGRGKDHLAGFAAQKDAQVAAICDVDENVLNRRLKEFETKYGTRPKGYSDMRKVLEDKEIDAMSIATPNH